MLSEIIEEKFKLCTDFFLPNPFEFSKCHDQGLDFFICRSTRFMMVKPKLEKTSLSKNKKRELKKKQKHRKDPFENPSTHSLFITQLNEQYSLIFNKFYFVPKHVLIVTTDFVNQNTSLTKDDFEVTMQVIEALEGMAYFNHGPESGMSQPHRHIQVVPLPLIEEKRPPIETLLFGSGTENEKNKVIELESLPYRNSFWIFSQDSWNAKSLLHIYNELLKSLDLFDTNKGDNNEKVCSYNWVCTKEYMMVVPRSISDLSVHFGTNSMGYTGSFFIYSENAEEYIKKNGPLKLLTMSGFKKH
ncbi:ap-4-a phosphorylase ii [Anaeramoeba flamelloides]|uniref:Ap-4-a phosphorylase ii n=1 Tax=Anaeramoeba flamelloides TaxID=1746091 RepID=A0AAV7YNS5_9EUKA|nr:ap-4-a phosphorylase ii [Anaeramoeba flamelloides]